jgi:hypothetical protein
MQAAGIRERRWRIRILFSFAPDITLTHWKQFLCHHQSNACYVNYDLLYNLLCRGAFRESVGGSRTAADDSPKGHTAERELRDHECAPLPRGRLLSKQHDNQLHLGSLYSQVQAGVQSPSYPSS